MSIKVHAACPICHKVLEYDHEGDAWGSISAWDYGIVEITGHDRGIIAEHINSHTFEERAEHQKQVASNLSARAAMTEKYAAK